MKKLAFSVVMFAPAAALAGGGGAAAPDGVGQSILYAVHYVAHALGLI